MKKNKDMITPLSPPQALRPALAETSAMDSSTAEAGAQAHGGEGRCARWRGMSCPEAHRR
eukprot:6805997-Pyramimonas_sp.AAC.1